MRKNWEKMLAVALCGVFVVATLSIATAQNDGNAEDEGRVVPIGPETRSLKLRDLAIPPRTDLDGLGLAPFEKPLLPGNPADIARMARPLSEYYIGVAVAPVSDALRAHVGIPEGTGLIVERVSNGSPADEGGLELHDILVAADGNDLANLEDLVAVVEENGGDNPTRFTLDVIRKGKSQTVWVTPAKRPEPAIGEFVPRLPPGLGLNLNALPGSMAIQMKDENGEKKITIERNGEKWEIDGNDPDAVKELPEDLRPMVERMLNGNGQLEFNFNGIPGGLPAQPQFEEMQQRMQEQMKNMEEKLKRLEQRFEEPTEEDPRA